MTKSIWRSVAATLVVALGISAALYTWWRPAEPGMPMEEASMAKASQRYHCPMHPTIVADRPGDCPICGMRLVPIEEEESPAAADAPDATPPGGQASPSEAEKKRTIYRSTMNPSEFSDQPGKDSMGMEMVAEEVEEAPAGSAVVEGRARVQLSERKRQLIGVRTGVVEKKPLVRTVRTVGLVTYDETHLHHVHTKISGWVEKLYANATGEFVKKGEPLLTIYSPELVASSQEYLLALHAKERLGASVVPSVQRSAERLVSSAHQRLLLFDLTPQQIGALESRGEVPTTMTLYAPTSGHIIARKVTQGEQIDPGMNLLDIADLSRVWVLADIYEYELPFLSLGQKAIMNLSYLPGRIFAGQVTLIYPVLTEATRTIKARLEFTNTDYSLRPEMYAEVEIFADLGERIVVPGSAVISSGTRDIVFVQSADGYLEPREVTLGVRLPDTFEILKGLAEGETVVTSGNFLLDSESKLKSALAASLGNKSDKVAAHSH